MGLQRGWENDIRQILRLSNQQLLTCGQRQQSKVFRNVDLNVISNQ